jgi:DNA-binding PadR family transcriptional regulator
MTWEQAGQTAAVASAWKRISELHERGIIEVVGTGKTSFGAKAQMYRITDDGRVALGGTR